MYMVRWTVRHYLSHPTAEKPGTICDVLNVIISVRTKRQIWMNQENET